MEFALRHWSNGGIRTPNREQDFLTVTIAFYLSCRRLTSSIDFAVCRPQPGANHLRSLQPRQRLLP